MNDHIHIPLEMRDRVLKEAAHTGTPRDAASVVLDALVQEKMDLAGITVDLDEIKQLLVDALRASRRGTSPPHGQMVG